jgi:hypothetical protein
VRQVADLAAGGRRGTEGTANDEHGVFFRGREAESKRKGADLTGLSKIHRSQRKSIGGAEEIAEVCTPFCALSNGFPMYQEAITCTLFEGGMCTKPN